jgi:hypothetical protein
MVFSRVYTYHDFSLAVIVEEIVRLIKSLLCSLLEEGIGATLIEEVVDLVKISWNVV